MKRLYFYLFSMRTGERDSLGLQDYGGPAMERAGRRS